MNGYANQVGGAYVVDGRRRRGLVYRPRSYAFHPPPIGSFWDVLGWATGEKEAEAVVNVTVDAAGWTGQAFVNLATDPIGTIEHVSDDVIHVAAAVVVWCEGAAEELVAVVRVVVKAVKTIAPFIQMGLSCIPGIGTVASAALGAAVALASGEPITDVLLAAAKGACPGGPEVADAVGAAFDAAVKIAQGDNVLDALGSSAIDAARNAAIDECGDAGAIAFDTALALAHGQKLQQVALSAGLDAIGEYVPNTPEAQAAFHMTGDALSGNPANPASLAALASGVAPPEAIEAAQQAGYVVGNTKATLDASSQAYALAFPSNADPAVTRAAILNRARRLSVGQISRTNQVSAAAAGAAQARSALFSRISTTVQHARAAAPSAQPKGAAVFYGTSVQNLRSSNATSAAAVQAFVAAQAKRAVYLPVTTLAHERSRLGVANVAQATGEMPAITRAAMRVRAEDRRSLAHASPAVVVAGGVAGVGVLGALAWWLLA